MSTLMQSVDERTQLAGTNRLEVLLFSLDAEREDSSTEVFAINVFKVREVLTVPRITRAPDMPKTVEGVVSLRGTTIPVINLMKCHNPDTQEKPQILLIAEYNMQVLGFLVYSVDTIKRMDWEQVKEPPTLLSNRMNGLLTGIAELEDKRLAMILDVEKVLAETSCVYDDMLYDNIDVALSGKDITVVYADDSSVARHQISRVLDNLGVKSISAKNGKEAWQLLDGLASQAQARSLPVKDLVQLILTDIEMPEMDGYVLTKKVKDDPRFNDIPVMMHSSLTAEANETLGKEVGADIYVPKFDPVELARGVEKLIS